MPGWVLAALPVSAWPVRALLVTAALVIALLAGGCSRAPQPAAQAPDAPAESDSPASSAQAEGATQASHSADSSSPPLVAAARGQIGVTRYYDPAYVQLAYPGGDVASDRGVCTDVVIRALRTQGLDLQRSVHEDMRADFSAYPSIWRAKSTDRSIDHRRVPNLRRWFERQRWSLPVSDRAADYRPGDLVTWELNGGLPHIGIVSDRKSWDRQRPLILHNIARGTQEDDVLFDYPITGHYRPLLRADAATAAR